MSTSKSGSGSSDSRKYVCLAPDCPSKPFSRVADLDRHYKSVHNRDEEKETFFCDYKKCLRHEEPLNRFDHLRDHLRDFHKEELPKKGTKSASPEGPKDRNGATWWRCYTCLERVKFHRYGSTCPTCNDLSQTPGA
ncbi:hypothetical protein QBC33DRAFT_582148 [Phialemonium atrogriseum]|uniref:C2H2-type domain-containing protein n=1 Tax=Phialemonium atrogriseum TaxID=1093897 RepID=A0AAJ0BQY8_9PEZI|nr:uncharacterized protein QBC33DRAFT_582148 [Phialemonium atrogriseum]KAK1761778.1 hypothetical protein QBC33DRAFT_582148 [Phialemonium atrogriseum]